MIHLNDKTGILFHSSMVPNWVNISLNTLTTLAMVPFATNPLIYVVSDQNYCRLFELTVEVLKINQILISGHIKKQSFVSGEIDIKQRQRDFHNYVPSE